MNDPIVSVLEGALYSHNFELLLFTHRCFSQIQEERETQFIDFIYTKKIPEPLGDYMIVGEKDRSAQVPIVSPAELFKILKKVSPRYIVVHGIFRDAFWLRLLCRPRLWKRTIWMVWGGDLASFVAPFAHGNLARQLVRRALLELCGRWIVPRLLWIGVLTPGDGNILRKRIPTASNIRRVFYPSQEVALGPEPPNPEGNGYLVICGNSGAPNNEHVGLIDIIRSIDNGTTRWLFVLSYGPSDTIGSVCDYGTRMLGASFRPLRELLPYRDYCRLFREAHALIYNHTFDSRSQQGLGGICIAMRLGKKVYIRSDNPLFAQLRDWGAMVYDTLELKRAKSNDFYEPINPDVAVQNKIFVEKYFSEEAALAAWREALASCVREPSRTKRRSIRR
jgi:hypothetical protein